MIITDQTLKMLLDKPAYVSKLTATGTGLPITSAQTFWFLENETELKARLGEVDIRFLEYGNDGSLDFGDEDADHLKPLWAGMEHDDLEQHEWTVEDLDEYTKEVWFDEQTRIVQLHPRTVGGGIPFILVHENPVFTLQEVVTCLRSACVNYFATTPLRKEITLQEFAEYLIVQWGYKYAINMAITTI